jgi:hypothetical protein
VHEGGVLVTGDSGDRKDGSKTAHVGRQWMGRYGKTDNGVVTVTTLWADERVYYRVDAVPYTPARHFAKGKNALLVGSSIEEPRSSRRAERAFCHDRDPYLMSRNAPDYAMSNCRVTTSRESG